MKKKYVSPLFAELELELESVLYDSNQDNNYEDGADVDWGSDFDEEEENFSF